MLRSYVFYEDKHAWIEETNLLLHDICAFIDDEKDIIYIWKGPKSSKQKFKNGYNSVENLVSNYPNSTFQLEVLKKEIPEEIQIKIEKMLETVRRGEEKSKLIFSRLITIRIFFIFSMISVILPIFLILNLYSSLFWHTSDSICEVRASIYDYMILFSRIVVIITLISLGINVAIGIYEQEHQVIIFNISGFIICVGILLFLNQGIFLFKFQEGSTLTNYLILKKDALVFLISIIIPVLLFEIPNLYKIISFLKTYGKFIF
ncbi:MAG: hypothetical protein ACFE8L_02670 [Candidatus Hodarchaeota archaeon]